MDQAYNDPQAKHMKLTQTVTATDGSEMTLPRQPFTLSRTPSKLAVRTPEFAEHTDEILAEFGFSAEEIKGLRERAAVE
jgi:crotonobetainyl-CoA:carnitine CoA-transferase CaiB-like acyl-CoA transferase